MLSKKKKKKRMFHRLNAHGFLKEKSIKQQKNEKKKN